jgi:hypothetical protein
MAQKKMNVCDEIEFLKFNIKRSTERLEKLRDIHAPKEIIDNEIALLAGYKERFHKLAGACEKLLRAIFYGEA